MREVIRMAVHVFGMTDDQIQRVSRIWSIDFIHRWHDHRSHGYIDWDTGIFHVVLLKFAVHEARISGNLCFANDILPGLDTEPQLI